MRRITKTKLADGIFLVRFATQYELAHLPSLSAFESADSPVGSLPLKSSWIGMPRNFTFSYFQTDGFQCSSTVFEPFVSGRFDPLLEKEKRLINLFEGEREPFYIIGVSESSARDDLTHEVAHALFFTDRAYKAAVLAALREYDTARIEHELHQLGYTKDVLNDEVHAYLISGDRSVKALANRRLIPLRKIVQAIFRAHSAPLIKRGSGTERKAMGRLPRRNGPRTRSVRKGAR
jgi:hypothetical protein